MTYQQLIDQLQQLTDEQLQQDVTIYDESIDEYFALKVELVETTDTCDVLDPRHIVIRF